MNNYDFHDAVRIIEGYTNAKWHLINCSSSTYEVLSEVVGSTA